MGEWQVLTAKPGPEAHVLLGALLAEGLRARLARDSLGVVYGLTRGPFATRVLVASDDFAAARSLLDEVENRC